MMMLIINDDDCEQKVYLISCAITHKHIVDFLVNQVNFAKLRQTLLSHPLKIKSLLGKFIYGQLRLRIAIFQWFELKKSTFSR